MKRQINPGEREGEGRYKDKIWGGKGERPLSEGGVAGSLCLGEIVPWMANATDK